MGSRPMVLFLYMEQKREKKYMGGWDTTSPGRPSREHEAWTHMKRGEESRSCHTSKEA